MSKGIYFYANKDDHFELFNLIKSLGGTIIDYCGEIITSYENYSMLIKTQDSKIYLNAGGKVDVLKSDVIEFQLSTKIPKEVLDLSRIKERFCKGNTIIIDNIEEYDVIMQEIKMNPQFVPNDNYVENGYQYGRLWIKNKHQEKEKLYIKKKSVIKIYNLLSKFIRSNYCTNNNDILYMGPNAYQEYLLGNYIAVSGKNIIKF